LGIRTPDPFGGSISKASKVQRPQEMNFCSKEITWCRRNISVEGIKFDPEMIESLFSLPEPENVANLQKFLCAANWIRSSIPEYAMMVAPLQEIMREIMRSTDPTEYA